MTLTTKKAETPFTERTGATGYHLGDRWVRADATTLGISRLSGVPSAGFPDRARCQSIVTDGERKKAKELAAAYVSAKAIREQNDIGHAAHRIKHAKYMNSGATSAFEVAAIEAEVRQMDGAAYSAAVSAQREANREANTIAVQILERLIDSFDSELNTEAIAAEERLRKMGVPLFHEEMVNGYQVRKFELHGDSILTALQVRRELSRKVAKQLTDHSDAGGMNELQWLATGAKVEMGWL